MALTSALVAGIGLAILPSNARAGQSTPLLVLTGAAQQPPGATGRTAEPPLSRWLDLEAVSISVRYRLVRTEEDVTRFNQAQTQETLRGRVKLDAGGRIAVGFLVQSGQGFPSSWNNTGIGTGEHRSSIYMKQLFAAVTPIRGVEADYGGFGLLHGENGEVTAYDNDGYLVGARVSVKRPAELFFDEISVTVGYLGDLTSSNVFTRFEHLDRQSFRQILVGKHLGTRVQVSTDYVDDSLEGGVWRWAARFNLATRLVDALRVEYAARVTDAPHDTAFGVTGEKTIGHVLLFVGSSRDRKCLAILNGDRYGLGTRLFTGGTWHLPADLAASWFVARELTAPEPSVNRLRLDLVLTWNALQTMRRAHIVK